ncbi:hypothetical protein LINGRAHAP2_LOCUS4675 [Linum grandiflorum]
MSVLELLMFLFWIGGG